MPELRGVYLSRGTATGRASLTCEPVDRDTVLLVHDLRDLPKNWLHSPVVGVVTTVGGRTSHAVLQARARQIPVLLVEPTDFEQLLRLDTETLELDSRDSQRPIVVPPEVSVLVNISDSSGWASAGRSADGVGMWRSEDFLTTDAEGLRAVHWKPAARDELSERVAHEIEQMAMAGRRPSVITVRVPDLTPPDLGLSSTSRTNYRLSVRGVRLLVIERHLLDSFLRGVARAVAGLERHDVDLVRILLPLVSSTAEVVLLRDIWSKIAADAGVEGLVRIGVAIETPALAWNPVGLASVCDFASCGTNDLVQYAWALDRDEGFADVLWPYERLGVITDDPFVSFAASGLAKVIKGVGDAFQGKPSRCRFGITGDLARDPDLLDSAHDLGIDYVALPTWATHIVERAGAPEET